jgi:hypothetical protein
MAVHYHEVDPHLLCFRTCAFLMKHLNRMASFGKKTCMTGRNLAIVWAPNLLRSDISVESFVFSSVWIHCTDDLSFTSKCASPDTASRILHFSL